MARCPVANASVSVGCLRVDNICSGGDQRWIKVESVQVHTGHLISAHDVIALRILRLPAVRNFDDAEFERVALLSQQRRLDRVEQRASKYRILSTLPYGKVPFWNNSVITELPDGRARSSIIIFRWFWNFVYICKILQSANRYDLILISGGERTDLLYLAVAGMCIWLKTPHIIVDAHWQKDKGVRGAVQSAVLALGGRLLRQVQPHSEEEIEIYSKQFSLDKKIFRAIPWSTSIIGYSATESSPEELTIVTGGFSHRDYSKFIEAAGIIGVKTKIGLPERHLSSRISRKVSRYPNIELATNWTNERFIQEIANCTIFAMPISPGLTRATADQTILNAMAFGRMVVASDSIGPRIYIKDGINGFLVAEASVECWLAALRRALLLSTCERTRVGARARRTAKVYFNETIRLVRTLEAALEVLS